VDARPNGQIIVADDMSGQSVQRDRVRTPENQSHRAHCIRDSLTFDDACQIQERKGGPDNAMDIDNDAREITRIRKQLMDPQLPDTQHGPEHILDRPAQHHSRK